MTSDQRTPGQWQGQDTPDQMAQMEARRQFVTDAGQVIKDSQQQAKNWGTQRNMSEIPYWAILSSTRGGQMRARALVAHGLFNEVQPLMLGSSPQYMKLASEEASLVRIAKAVVEGKCPRPVPSEVERVLIEEGVKMNNRIVYLEGEEYRRPQIRAP